MKGFSWRIVVKPMQESIEKLLENCLWIKWKECHTYTWMRKHYALLCFIFQGILSFIKTKFPAYNLPQFFSYVCSKVSENCNWILQTNYLFLWLEFPSHLQHHHSTKSQQHGRHNHNILGQEILDIVTSTNHFYQLMQQMLVELGGVCL